jgi:hypothetical protein
VIATGAQRMVADGATTEEDVAQARQCVERLPAEMNTERVGTEQTFFSEGTLAGALERLCPAFWPFC